MNTSHMHEPAPSGALPPTPYDGDIAQVEAHLRWYADLADRINGPEVDAHIAALIRRKATLCHERDAYRQEAPQRGAAVPVTSTSTPTTVAWRDEGEGAEQWA